jgi:hypothetical protein
MGGLRRLHRPELGIRPIVRSQPGMGPGTEKRTVSSAHVPDLDGDRLGVQELVALLALGDVPEGMLCRFGGQGHA